MEQLGEALIIVVALSVGAFVKGLTGTGLPQIAIPVMAATLGVERAVVVMAIPGIVSNAWLVWANRDMVPATRDLPALTVAGILGAGVGTVALTSVDGRLLSVVLASVILAYVVVVTWRPDLSLSARLTRWTSPPVGLVAGGLQGATGVSGPLLSTYLHGFALTPAAYVLSLSTLFLIFSVVQVATIAGLGFYTAGLLRESLLALVPIAVVLPLANRVSRRLPADLFRRLVLAGLVVAAAVLVVNAVRG
ncbi:sulfite exporter TauE/SafE family protein [Nocardioides caldifontis]|uniref:sulfite exporter TauE/SafE family protein n=1 Tax=Nocardioides caldifontis TaxID=2588938 RepID=UPI001396C102|nr:sulfite exporter TauE/SafE family protein [Nocardioides caldifontis]